MLALGFAHAQFCIFSIERMLSWKISHLQLPEFGADNKPDQPLQFHFPKREFGKTKIHFSASTDEKLSGVTKNTTFLTIEL